MFGLFKNGCRCGIVLAGLLALASSGAAQSGGIAVKYTVYGTVYDSATQKPAPYVTVQLVGTSRTTLTNDSGQYRINIDQASATLKFSHVAYYTQQIPVTVSTASAAFDIYLHPSLIEIPGIRVLGRRYEPGEEIIIEAIRRKREILAKLKQFNCDAYTKMVVRDMKKPDSTNIFLITESQVSCFWEAPDQYKEIIRAREQSANIKAENNLVAVGRILNFNENRIGPGIVSPTATDALDYYRYFLLDTIDVEGQRVFVLEIEAKNDVDLLFEGTIQIADSSYDVVAVDVGVSKGFPQSFFRNPHYSQRCARFADGVWMPVEIRFALDLKFSIKVPGIPAELNVKHVASLHSYSFDRHEGDKLFNEFALEVDPEADEMDSSYWRAVQAVPLTLNEMLGYRRLDSMKRTPKPVYKQIPTMLMGAALAASLRSDLFHYNRVEGAYAGLGLRLKNAVPNMNLRFKSGYAFEGEFWQHAYGATWHIPGRARMEASVEWHDVVEHRPAVVTPRNLNPTAPALLSGQDPLDYFGEKGYSLGLSSKVGKRTRLGFGFTDVSQRSLPVTTRYSFFASDTAKVRGNPGIVDGKLRSISAHFNYDSRPLYKTKSKIDTLADQTYTHIEAIGEYASPSFIKNDFDFRRYGITLFTRQRLLGLGLTSFQVVWGSADGALPPQRYYTVSINPWGMFNGKGFQTLDTLNFTGNQVFAVTAQHDFGRRLFGKSGIPLIKKIPFTVGIHGGAFWTEFRAHPYQPGDESVHTARHAYSELGFSVGNITPFLAPFNLRFGFTWQLSDYPTNRFALSWDFAL